MKNKRLMLILVLLLFLTLPSSVYGGYYALGAGPSGEEGGRSVTLEIGSENFRLPFAPYRFLGAVGLFGMDHGGNIPAGTIGSPCPHTDFTSAGKEPDGTESGIVGRIGMEILESRFFVSVLEGMSWVNEIDLVRSNPTGQYYEQSKERNLQWVIGIGVGYFPEIFDWKMKLAIQVDYDTRRGITGSLGWGW